MHALPAVRDLQVNPYESPQTNAEPLAAPKARESSLALRSLVYLLAGGLLFAAFSTPLNIAHEMFWNFSGPNWIAFGSVLASTLLTGLVCDGLIRSEWSSILVGILWTMLNAAIFAPLLLMAMMVIGFATGTSGDFSLGQLFAVGLFATIYGAIYGVLCMHLALPIGIACIGLIRSVA